MKVAANLTMLFQEAGTLIQRYEAAAVAGFKCVEVSAPYDTPAAELKAVKERLGLEQVLINTPMGKGMKDRGLACIPARKDEFRRSIDKAIDYARQLKCSRVHVMAGLPAEDVLRVTTEQCFVENLRYAAEKLGDEGITCLIEPLSPQGVPGYFLNSYDQALGYLQTLRLPNLKIQLDFFHAQNIAHDNLTELVAKLGDSIGHVQVAQVPSRNEPNKTGELDYRYVFQLLEEAGYEGFIGAEYKPSGLTTAAGLSWVEEMGLQF